MRVVVDPRILSLHLLNLLDGLFTLIAVSIGVEEANPLLRPLLELDPILFISVKFLTVALSIAYLDKQVTNSLHRSILFGVLRLIYALVICWHLIGFTLLLSTG